MQLSKLRATGSREEISQRVLSTDAMLNCFKSGSHSVQAAGEWRINEMGNADETLIKSHRKNERKSN